MLSESQVCLYVLLNNFEQSFSVLAHQDLNYILFHVLLIHNCNFFLIETEYAYLENRLLRPMSYHEDQSQNEFLRPHFLVSESVFFANRVYSGISSKFMNRLEYSERYYCLRRLLKNKIEKKPI